MRISSSQICKPSGFQGETGRNKFIYLAPIAFVQLMASSHSPPPLKSEGLLISKLDDISLRLSSPPADGSGLQALVVSPGRAQLAEKLASRDPVDKALEQLTGSGGELAEPDPEPEAEAGSQIVVASSPYV